MQEAVSRASSVIIAASSPPQPRSRLPYPDWPGRYGNMPARFLRAYRIQRRSLAMPSNCWATARQASSASDRAGLQPER
jgi:hypothetical protein